jgi:hypothetical protein
MTGRKKRRANNRGAATRIAVVALVALSLFGWERSIADDQVPDSFRLVLFPGSQAGTAKTCAAFLAAVEGHPINGYNGIEQGGQTYWDESALYSQWIGGFMSGMNLVEKMKTGKQVTMNWPDIEAWLRDYCGSHPDDNIIVAIEQFYFPELTK